jgi:hypothetical protein
LTITAEPTPVADLGGFGAACGAIEGLWRGLAVVLGPYGVRANVIRSAGSPDAPGVQAAVGLRAENAPPRATRTSVRQRHTARARSTARRSRRRRGNARLRPRQRDHCSTPSTSPAAPISTCERSTRRQWARRLGSTARRAYFPREVFFFGFGFLPVFPEGGSFFGRFGDTRSLLPGLTVPRCPLVRIRSDPLARPAGSPARRYRSASPACQSTEPSAPRPETAIVNGCRKRARPAKVARRCGPPSSSRATAVSRPSQQTTRQRRGSGSADHSTRS